MELDDGWAVRRRDGSIVVEVGAHASETCIWRIALGWPSDEEIASEKAAGGYSFRCRVVPLLSDGCTQALLRGTLDSAPMTITHE